MTVAARSSSVPRAHAVCKCAEHKLANAVHMHSKTSCAHEPDSDTRSISQGVVAWEPCRVLQYDYAKDAYVVEWVSSGRRKLVKRLNLLFAHESQSAFRQRVCRAHKLRAEAERAARFHRHVDAQQFSASDVDVGALRTKLLQMVPWRASSAGFEEMLQEVLRDFVRAVKRSTVEHALMSASGRTRLAASGVRPTLSAPDCPWHALPLAIGRLGVDDLGKLACVCVCLECKVSDLCATNVSGSGGVQLELLRQPAAVPPYLLPDLQALPAGCCIATASICAESGASAAAHKPPLGTSSTEAGSVPVVTLPPAAEGVLLRHALSQLQGYSVVGQRHLLLFMQRFVRDFSLHGPCLLDTRLERLRLARPMTVRNYRVRLQLL